MKKLLLFGLIWSNLAYSELPPPGTARKGKITVEPNNKGDVFEYDLEYQKVVNRQTARAFNLKVKKEVEAMRKKVRDLEAENDRLRNRPLPLAVSKPRTVERVVEVDRVADSRHSIGLYGGVMPDGVHVDGQNLSRKAEIHENGFAVGASYDYKFSEHWSVEAFGAVTTRDTYLYSGFIGPKYHW